ncbi:hypothetical protein L1871_14635 [Aeromonas caviae]|uniref:hypothetical protein n=1 Tax=Aeromonas caviae TaxID=648 RepID=UPI001F3A06A1|nr:hypothetical protein [Aeromonas caviae]UJQ35597.1 hypothetical protein L1871_14635 [Aeromonas caviae]
MSKKTTGKETPVKGNLTCDAKSSGQFVKRDSKTGRLVSVSRSDKNARILAATVGGAVIGNILVPGLGGAIVGGLAGAFVGNSSDEGSGDE